MVLIGWQTGAGDQEEVVIDGGRLTVDTRPSASIGQAATTRRPRWTGEERCSDAAWLGTRERGNSSEDQGCDGFRIIHFTVSFEASAEEG